MLPILAAIVLTVLATLVVLNLRAEKKIDVKPTHIYAVSDPQFLRSMSVLLGPPLTEGNRVETLLNGDRIFPSMLQAIASARQTISFETYIYWSGDIGKRFAEALAERSRAGVKVHVLVDWLGSQKMDNDSIEVMTQAGVDFRKYRPLRWYNLGRINNRTHRKLLVVDGRIGFTGGVGIADNWTGNAQDPEHWRDNHYRLEGPAVAQMQAAFMDNWTKVSGVGPARRPVLSRLEKPSGAAVRASVSELERRRLREHAPDVSAVDCGRHEDDRSGNGLLRAGRSHQRGA